MSHYLHHVPGRLRLRSKHFRCNPAKARLLESQLQAIDGVLDVRYNVRNASLTVQYDPDTGASRHVVDTLTEAGCLPVAKTAAGNSGQELAVTFGHALLTALAQQTVARSFSTLAFMRR